jgi:dimethylargininase
MSIADARRFHSAIVRLPGEGLERGLARDDLGKPRLDLALDQHRRYRDALESCGMTVTVLAANPAHPDGTFVEDTAVVLPTAALVARPGAPSRLGEVAAIDVALRAQGLPLATILSPGTLDGGDVCEIGDRVFVGLSARTNAEGAAQLTAWLAEHGMRCTTIDIGAMSSILHLKSGVAWLGGDRVLAIDELARHRALSGFDIVPVDPDEAYAANVVRVNDHVLVASGFPRLAERLEQLGYRTIVLDMSEFAKLDGGLSCLSLRL